MTVLSSHHSPTFSDNYHRYNGLSVFLTLRNLTIISNKLSVLFQLLLRLFFCLSGNTCVTVSRSIPAPLQCQFRPRFGILYRIVESSKNFRIGCDIIMSGMRILELVFLGQITCPMNLLKTICPLIAFLAYNHVKNVIIYLSGKFYTFCVIE